MSRCFFGIGRTITLPVFHNNIQGEEAVDGYDILKQIYIHGMNKVEIQPLRHVGPAIVPVGEPYTIGYRHLVRMEIDPTRITEVPPHGSPAHT